MTAARFVAGFALLAVGVLAGWALGERLTVAALSHVPEWTWDGPR